MSGTTGRPAEVLPKGSGIRVGGTAGEGLTISTYIKDAENLPLAKDLLRLIYHRQALSNELLPRAVTGTSILTLRGVLYTFVSKRASLRQISMDDSGRSRVPPNLGLLLLSTATIADGLQVPSPAGRAEGGSRRTRTQKVLSANIHDRNGNRPPRFRLRAR